MQPPFVPTVLRIFVSSPGDVPGERQAVVRVSEALRAEPLLGGKVVVQAVLWEHPGFGGPTVGHDYTTGGH